MARNPRPFNAKALTRFAVPGIRAQLGPETLVRRYTILVPVEELKAGAAPRIVATAEDLQQLQLLLIKHFGGVTQSTTTPSLLGCGARDPQRPTKTQEVNRHAYFAVYAAALRASDEYFPALQRELADALVEGIIPVERQDVTIL
jgi:hypothetical protein